MPKKTQSLHKSEVKRVCFCCEKSVGVVAFPESVLASCPNDATYWRTSGNYGSTVFDPMDGTFLEFYVCDPCLVSRKDRVFRGRTLTTKTTVLLSEDVFDSTLPENIAVGTKVGVGSGETLVVSETKAKLRSNL